MTPAERAALMAKADEWERKAAGYRDYYAACEKRDCADQLRALLAEMEREDGDG